MGSFSSAPGLALVVPAYFVCAGILLFTAVTAAIVGLHRTRAPIYLTFAAVTLFSALATASIASYYLADSVRGGVEALRWGWTAGALLLGSIFCFVAVYTEAGNIRIPATLMGVFVAAFITANHTLPLGARFAEVEVFRWMQLPWGESIFQLMGPTTGWLLALRIASILVIFWSIRHLVTHCRRGNVRESGVLATYLVVLFMSSAHGALIDAGVVQTPHSMGVALVGLTLLMGVHLVLRLREQNVALRQAAIELRQENERRRAAELEIRERAYMDPLTGLPNRMAAGERLTGMLEGPPGSHGAVILLDLDHFKVINEGMTHEVGDQILREVARRLGDAAQGRATVARIGGDAFMAILDAHRESEAEAQAAVEALARDLARALSQAIALGERSFNIAASYGIATFATGGATATEVLGRVDMALHRAKRRGRNTIQTFRPGFQEEAAERFRIVEGLRGALERGELALHYQAQVDGHGRVTGAEALMRWTPRGMGPVPPSVFIPVAEETGLIHSLGEWSLRGSCRRLAAWSAMGFHGSLSVNVSPWQLARPDFVGRLVEIMRTSGTEPARLTLEITESAVLFDVGETEAKLREIRRLGVRVALDDFGTGYSSLALIKDLPLDVIKIDQSFVRHLREGANTHLIRVIVAIGRELGLDVIAEGVETPAERDQLLQLGCARLQGYLYGRPVPEAAFLDSVLPAAAREQATA